MHGAAIGELIDAEDSRTTCHCRAALSNSGVIHATGRGAIPILGKTAQLGT